MPHAAQGSGKPRDDRPAGADGHTPDVRRACASKTERYQPVGVTYGFGGTVIPPPVPGVMV